MNTFRIIAANRGRDGFIDETLPWTTINTGLTEKEANKSLWNLNFTMERVLVECEQTGERFHFSTAGLRSLNSY